MDVSSKFEPRFLNSKIRFQEDNVKDFSGKI